MRWKDGDGGWERDSHRRMFTPALPVLRRGCLLAGVQSGGAKFRSLDGGEELNQSSVSKHFVLTGQWGQAVQLISYEAKNGHFELALSQVNHG